MLARIFYQFGLLRALLAFSTLALILISPFVGKSDTEPQGLFLSAIAPSLVMILFFVLPLDIAMTRIFMSDASTADKTRFAVEYQTPVLVERANQIPWALFTDVKTIGLTAGASAPEVLVEEVIEAFRERFDVKVEVVTTLEERVVFNVPRELRAPRPAL